MSLELSSVCIVDAKGKIIREAKVENEPGALVAFLQELGLAIERIGLEAGPLSQWLHAGLTKAGFETVLLEIRHVKAALSASCNVRSAAHDRPTCNLYSLTRTQDAMRALFRVKKDLTGNLPPMPGIFPDYSAPIVRMTDGEHELAMARWGMPSPAFALKGRTTDPGVTNVRNTTSPHWRRWLGPANRCIVPFTSFSEYETEPDGKKILV